jgi:hypothetical protein
VTMAVIIRDVPDDYALQATTIEAIN